MAATKLGRFLSDPSLLMEKLSCPCSGAPSFRSSLEHFVQAATSRTLLQHSHRSAQASSEQHLHGRRASGSSHRQRECSRFHCANPIASLNQPKVLSPSTSISRTGLQTHWKEPSSRSRERFGRLRAVKTEAPVDERKAEWGSELEAWLGESGLPEQPVEIADVGPKGLGVKAKRVILKGEVALQVPEHLTVTGVDVANHPVVANIAEGRGDVIGLTLWVMYERSLGEQSGWWPFVRMFPQRTRSPLLWTSEKQNELLRGSPVLADVQERLRAVESEYAQLSTFFSGDPELFLPPFFSFEAFKETFAVVLSRVVFLPSADCFALVPFADCINHASDSTASLDFSADENAVVLTADRDYQPGDEVVVTYGADKPNSELLINYGFVDPNNSNDCLFQPAELLPTDRLMGFKQQIVEQAGFGVKELFPLLLNRFPTQLLVYLRLSRLQDPAQFPKVNFEKDMVVSQENEYEILMLLMADMRERLQSYENQTEDEMRLLNTRDLSPEGRLACQLRIGEQRILQSTMTAVRNRLAPIRGVPTKSGGMQDPNADIIEMFDQVESIVSAPGKFFQKVLGRDK